MTRDESRDVGVSDTRAEPWPCANADHFTFARYVPADHLFAAEARLRCAVELIENLERSLQRQQEIALESSRKPVYSIAVNAKRRACRKFVELLRKDDVI